MRRHLDNHPGLSIFSSISSVSNGTSSSASSSSSNNSPAEAGRSNAAPKPLLRQPLALIQETVHALGPPDGMQSGVHFSLPPSGYQSRVQAAATTLSQGSLGHSQAPPVHLQAHSNAQPQQPNSQTHVAQMQGQMQFQKLKVEDALSYLDQVKYKFGNQPQVYNDFLDIMKEFKSQSIDTPGVIQRVSNLFRGHPELIVGFNTFLPPGYRIEVQPNEQVQVSIPGGGPNASLTIHPTGPPSAITHPIPPAQVPSHKSSVHSTPLTNNNSNNQTSSLNNSGGFGGGLPGGQTPSPRAQSSSPGPPGQNSTPQTNQPVEFNHAINYVNKIKNRFQGQPDIYKQFLEILHTYQKEQRNLKDGLHAVAKPLTEAEVYSQVAKLFQNQEDLLAEFGQFLPDANGAANALVSLQPVKIERNEHSSVVKKPLLPVKPPINNQAKQIQAIKRPASSIPSPPIKKPKMTSLKDVTLTEAGKYGSLNEFAFFDKVRKALKNADVYDDFLRCLIIYNQELISRSDLVLVVTPFLSKHPDLFKWFKDFLGYKETNNIEIIPKMIETQERERNVNDFATEIDYASCVKYGASYRAVPRNYVQPKCSGRTALCREVLNDTWVSFPSWSEDSTFVSSRKTQFEEYIYRCEDERFELDVVLETNLSTIRYLEAEMTKMNRMSAEDKARYRLDDTLGGISSVIQQRAVRRIYGDKASDIIEGLKRNPASSVPLVLRRLKSKDEEWRKAQKSFNKIWKEQNEKYYLKSLDHQGINFKQNDVKYLRSKSILNEIETIYEERHEQADDGAADIPVGPHMVVTYRNPDIFKDAANLIIHHVKRQTGIHKEDKQKIKHLMRQFFPDFFSVPRGDQSDDEMDKDDDMETEDGNESPKSSVYRDLLALSRLPDLPSNGGSPAAVQDPPAPMDNALPDESYTLMFVNNNWYIFFRLHNILCERLHKVHERAQVLISEELRDQEERKKSTALALRLKPRNNINVDMFYSGFLEMVKSLLDGNTESSQYEDSLRDMFGIHAYLGFTLDKVIQNVVRQLQHIVGDESCTQWTSLYVEEGKGRATGGSCASAVSRQAAEQAYQKRAEQMCEENLYKLIMYKQERKLTIELLDTDSDASDDQSGNKWNAFVRKYSCEESLADRVKERLAKSPIFLPRQINSWLAHAKNVSSGEERRESEEALRSIQEEIDTREIDLSRLEDGGAGEAVKGLVGLNARAKFLEAKAKSRIQQEQNSTGSSTCKFNVNSYKMMWIIDSENCFFKKKCLTKAKESHAKVSERLYRRFKGFHDRWLSDNVNAEQERRCCDWLNGRVEDSKPTTCVRVDDPTSSPYHPFHQYRASAPPNDCST